MNFIMIFNLFNLLNQLTILHIVDFYFLVYLEFKLLLKNKDIDIDHEDSLGKKTLDYADIDEIKQLFPK